MADRKYQQGRPTQEVRLRNWQPGRVAQFKKAIEILETELNNAMSAQTNQGAKRVVIDSLPIVTGLSVVSGFKSFQITFDPARTIKNLLFYEIQKDSSSSFSNPTTYNSPQTTLTIPTSTEHEIIYVRVRVMNSKFQVGRWSAIGTATGSSNFRINTTRGVRTTLEIAPANFNTWVDVQTLSIPTTTAAISVSVQPGVNARITLDIASTPPIINFQNVYTVKFRLLKDGVAYTNAGQCKTVAISSYTNGAGEGGGSEEKIEVTVFGVIVSPLVTYSNSETVIFTIQAYVQQQTTPDFEFTYSQNLSTFVLAQVLNNPLIIIDNFDVLEVIQVS